LRYVGDAAVGFTAGDFTAAFDAAFFTATVTDAVLG